MTGLKEDNPLDAVFRKPGMNGVRKHELNRDEIKTLIDDMQQKLFDMHKAVIQTTENERKRKREKSSTKHQRLNCGVGDYVLIGLNVFHAGQKLFLKWRGPYQVVKAEKGFVFEVKNLIDGSLKVVHGDRIRLYADNKLNVTEELKTQFAFDNATFEVENVLDVRDNKETENLEAHVKWLGFSELENTWEPLAQLIEDAPTVIQNFVENNPEHLLMEQVKQALHGQPVKRSHKRRKASTQKQ